VIGLAKRQATKPASAASFEEEVDYWKEPAKRRGCIGGLA
jgi:hypothetical protein